MILDIKFCNPVCDYLQPKESEQELGILIDRKIIINNIKIKWPHRCNKYNENVKHYCYHPNILAVEKCDEV